MFLKSIRIWPDSYGFEEHFEYLENAINQVVSGDKITLVLHDWGSALGFHWAFKNQDRMKGIAYMEGIVKELKWEEWNEQSRGHDFAHSILPISIL